MSLDATVGGVDSNSYVTVDEANAYFTDRAHSIAWKEADNQEQLLITASSVLDWYVTWKGVKTSNDQAMEWPRTGVYDGGVLIADNVIPKKVKIAVYELALSSIASDRTDDNPLAGLAEVKAASLKIKTNTEAYAKGKETIPDKIWNILRGLTTRNGAGIVHLVRA